MFSWWEIYRSSNLLGLILNLFSHEIKFSYIVRMNNYTIILLEN
jgi:hypothetical protein